MEIGRSPDRHTSLVAQCRSRSGSIIELPVLDVSPIGILVDRLAWSAKPGDRVLVKLKGLSFQPAEITWIDDDCAGITFEQQLYDAVVVHLKELIPPAMKKAS